MIEKSFEYFGKLAAIAGKKSDLYLVTELDESRATALFHLNTDDWQMQQYPLAGQGYGIRLADKHSGWIYGELVQPEDAQACHQVWHFNTKQKKQVIENFAAPFEQKIIDVTWLKLTKGHSKVAIATGNFVHIFDEASQAEIQTLSFDDPVTALAAAPQGDWLAVGMQSGKISVYQCEETQAYQLSDSADIHAGAVKHITFDPQELKFFSTGADNRLLVTYARGKLEPEDRGQSKGHQQAITSMLQGANSRFFTGSTDGRCCAWQYNSARTPSSFSKASLKAVALAEVSVAEKPFLAIANQNNAIMLVSLDDERRLTEQLYQLDDGYQLTRDMLSQTPAIQKQALNMLAHWGDLKSLEMINKFIWDSDDLPLRITATQILMALRHPCCKAFANKLLNANAAEIRQLAFKTLPVFYSEPLDAWQLALKSSYYDIGYLAINELAEQAKTQDQALGMIIGSLDSELYEVRCYALSKLFELVPAQACSYGLAAEQSDIRRITLIQMFRQGQLASNQSQGLLRRAIEDDYRDIRHTAYLLLLLSQPLLAQTLRAKDEDLHRQLFEIEHFTLPDEAEDPCSSKPLPKAVAPKQALTSQDLQPLLQVCACRKVDISLEGAYGLALVQDQRALALLLQLSQESAPEICIRVCRAFAALDNLFALQQLQHLMNHKQESVRDAAFSAIEVLQQQTPFETIKLGLHSDQQDIRLRALNLLVQALQQQPSLDATNPCLPLLKLALNDKSEALRKEAFKTIINLQQEKDISLALDLPLQSVYLDVRKEVMFELMAQATQSWALEKLQTLLNDADLGICREVFEFILKQTKGRDVNAIAKGILSQHVQIRRLALTELAKKIEDAAAQQWIINACNDEDADLRVKAIESVSSHWNASQLKSVLESAKYDNVRLAAAKTLADFKDPAAMVPLLEYALSSKPNDKNQESQWQDNAVTALKGLRELQQTQVLASILPLLNSDNDNIKKAASEVFDCARFAPVEEYQSSFAVSHFPAAQPEQIKQMCQLLRPYLQAEKSMAGHIALGMALNGDQEAADFLLNSDKHNIRPECQMMVAMLFERQDFLVQQLDSYDRSLRCLALMLLLMSEYRKDKIALSSILPALSAKSSQVRLYAADSLTQLDNLPEYLAKLSTSFMNNRHLQVLADQMEILIHALVFGDGVLKLEAWWVTVKLFDVNTSTEQFTKRMKKFVRDSDKALTQAKQSAKRYAGLSENIRPLAESGYLHQLQLGTYVGLLRDENITASVISRLRQITPNETNADEMLFAYIPALKQALHYSRESQYLPAYELLESIYTQQKLDLNDLAEEALNTGHYALGIKAQELLSRNTNGIEIIEKTLLTCGGNLAVEAAKLWEKLALTDTDLPDETKVAKKLDMAQKALMANSSRMRMLAISWLEELAPEQLETALHNHHKDVRDAAIKSLANKRHPACFASLVEMLNQADYFDQNSIIQMLKRLVGLVDEQGQPLDIAKALLDRIEHVSGPTANTHHLFKAVKDIRCQKAVPRLLTMLQTQGWNSDAATTLLSLSGCTQPLDNNGDLLPEHHKQYPRYDDVLAQLMEAQFNLGNYYQVNDYLGTARYCFSNAVDTIIARCIAASDQSLAAKAAETLGWRLHHRSTDVAPMLEALKSPHELVRFYAAESLAHMQRSEGIEILLASVELLSDIALRRRAVLSLGELQNARTLDVLLGIANNSGHALQAEAGEAIGHLGELFDKDHHQYGEQIFKRLKSSVASSDWRVRLHAIKGLRWFDSYQGWQLVRGAVFDRDEDVAATALEMLAFNDDDATRTLLLNLLANKPVMGHGKANLDADQLTVTFKSAKKLHTKEPLAPDYAYLSSGRKMASLNDQIILERVCEQGELSEIFSIVESCHADVRQHLRASLIKRTFPSLGQLADVFGSNQWSAIELAADLMVYHSDLATFQLRMSLSNGFDLLLTKWMEYQQNRHGSGRSSQLNLPHWRKVILKLIWAMGELAQTPNVLQHNFIAFESEVKLQRAIVTALISQIDTKLDTDAKQFLTEQLSHADNEIRLMAFETLARFDTDSKAQLIDRALNDQQVFSRLTHKDKPALSQALVAGVSELQQQAMTMDTLIANRAFELLYLTVRDTALAESLRMGAIIGLSQANDTDAEQYLVQIGQNNQLDEEYRKAAWRYLRRSKRARECHQQQQIQQELIDQKVQA